MFPNDNEFDTKVTLETEMSPMGQDLPFYILLLGDWSGRESRASDVDSAKFSPIEIDRDNFEDALRKLNVGLNLDFQATDETPLSLIFKEFEDFHPDKIFQQLPLFADLRDVRRRLVNSQTFNEAAREVRSWLVETKDEKTLAANPQDDMAAPETAPNDLLNQILGRTDENTHSQTTDSSELSAFIKKLVKPHLVQTDMEEQAKLLMIVDEVISDLMRKILHHPQFQALESAWRGIYLLIKRVETDRELKIYLLDITKDELTANLKSNSDLTASLLYRTLSQQAGKLFDDKSWAVICGNYTFALNVDDAAALMRIAKIAADTNTPFISHIKPEIFGFESFAETDASDSWKISEGSAQEKIWTMLRALPEASHLALALPRTLGRLPYGQNTEPTEAFYFEEFTASIQHEDYLWTNPVFVSTLLMAQTFRQFEWNMSQNFFQNFDGLSAHLYKDGIENKTKPCSEIFMTQSNCERILEQGLIPVISYKNDDKIRFGSFQSIAYPPSILKGKWK